MQDCDSCGKAALLFIRRRFDGRSAGQLACCRCSRVLLVVDAAERELRAIGNGGGLQRLAGALIWSEAGAIRAQRMVDGKRGIEHAGWFNERERTLKDELSPRAIPVAIHKPRRGY